MRADRGPARGWRWATLALLAAAGVGAAIVLVRDDPPGPRDWLRVNDPARDARPESALILDAIGAKPGMRIADVGAGAGYFTFKLTRLVGPGGHVYATETDDDLVERLREVKAARGVRNLTVIDVPGWDEFSTQLPPRSVETIVMVNLYAWTADEWLGFVGGIDAAEDHLESCRDALIPGGKLVVFQDKSGKFESCALGGCNYLSAAQVAALLPPSLSVEREVRIDNCTEEDGPRCRPGFLMVVRKTRSRVSRN